MGIRQSFEDLNVLPDLFDGFVSCRLSLSGFRFPPNDQKNKKEHNAEPACNFEITHRFFAALAVKDSSGVTTAPGSMTVGLRCSSFEYLDSREASEPLRGAEEMFDGILKAKIFNYEEDETPLYTLTLTEMRSQPS